MANDIQMSLATRSSYKMPYKLSELCITSVAELIDTSIRARLKDGHRLLGDAPIPAEIAEKIFESCQVLRVLSDNHARIFGDLNKFRLNHIRIQDASMHDGGLRLMLQHLPTTLHINKIPSITPVLFDMINTYGTNLESLHIGPLCPVFAKAAGDFKQGVITLRLDNLKYLSLHKQVIFYPMQLMGQLRAMTHLNLSECTFTDELVFNSQLQELLSLILHDVNLNQKTFSSILFLKRLQHLDISTSMEPPREYDNPNYILGLLVENLPDLRSLDISGTNLAGNGVAVSKMPPALSCDIPGLDCRVNNPLQFLGLYGSAHLAYSRHDIPAIEISGQANEEQLYTAAMAYKHRPEILTRVMNDLYHWFRYESEKITQINKALSVVLDAMDTHCFEKHIQISGSAAIFYIVKGKEKMKFDTMLKRHIINTLLNGMQTHLDDDTMMRNGCLTLCQFLIPADIIFEFKRIVTVLLYGATYIHQLPFVQRIAIFILNSLACQVDSQQKKFLGDIGTISKLLTLITDRATRLNCDDVLELAWSTMWNITDETPSNCRKFIDGDGIFVFLHCLNSFQSYFRNTDQENRAELLRNMMGLLGNVAEVASLRYAFMKPEFLSVCSDLLDSYSDGIEVSYNAAGVMAHLASDGSEAWTVSEPSREHVLERMVAAIERWDIQSTRNINYRSFEPILGLLKAYHTSECQHWAVWALANLTTVYPEKYCSLVQEENGRQLLQDVVAYPAVKKKIKIYAYQVLENCSNYQANVVKA